MIRRIGLNSAAAAFGLLIAAAPAAAQETPWSLDARGGVAFPVAELSDLAVESAAPTFGLGVAYQVHPRVELRADGDVDLLLGDDGVTLNGAEAADLRLWHYGAGAEVELTEPGASPWTVSVSLGAGATTFDSEELADGENFSETYFSANGGLSVGYDVTPRVNLFAGGDWRLMFTDEEDTARLVDLLGNGESEAFDTASIIPVTVGAQVRF